MTRYVSSGRLNPTHSLTHFVDILIGVSRLPDLDCGTTFHPGFDGRDFPSILLDNLWKHIFLATEVPSDSFDLFGLYK